MLERVQCMRQETLKTLGPALKTLVVQRGLPGLSLAITTREETLFLYSYGFANVEAQRAIDETVLFQIGSISKMFTALAVLQEAEKGRLELHAPVTKYLPWFTFGLGDITVHHLLTHTAGLPEGSDGSPDSLYSVYVMNELKSIWKPGEHFYYSNIGYKALGLVLEKVTGKPYADIIRENILQPLNMKNSEPITPHALYPRLAIGYSALYDDRPSHPSHPLKPATWTQNTQGDGSIASTANDMLCFARAMLKENLLSKEIFTLLASPHVADNAGEPFTAYGYGTMLMSVNNSECFGHTGAMVGFQSALLIDPKHDYGIVLLINSLGRLDTIDVVSAVHKALLEPSQETFNFPVSQSKDVQLGEYVGVYQNENETLEFTAEEDKLHLRSGSLNVLLETQSEDKFYALHPHFERDVFQFEHDEQNTVTHVIHGNDVWFNANYQGEKTFACPEEWQSYHGHYCSYSPWLPSLRVTLVKGQLRFDGDVLQPQADGSFRPSGAQPNVLVFHDVVDGKAQRLRLSGSDFYRVGEV
jgi:D-alanyl-D-alanine carboxypeptidase